MLVARALWSIALALLFLFWPWLALSSLFLFDAPGSNESPSVLLLATSIWLYPFLAILGSLLSWGADKRGQVRSALGFACLPFPCVVIMAIICL